MSALRPEWLRCGGAGASAHRAGAMEAADARSTRALARRVASEGRNPGIQRSLPEREGAVAKIAILGWQLGLRAPERRAASQEAASSLASSERLPQLIGRTFAACRPLGPLVTSNCTF